MKTPPNNTSDAVEQYALDVTGGKEVAGPLVRLACERHLRDLVDGPKRGLYWDRAWAERTFGYFKDVLRLAGGQFEGQPFKLEPAQQFIVGSLFGWKNAQGHYRFTTAYIEMGKGGGKSPLAGGIALLKITNDGEARAQGYTAATDKEQARIPFLDVVAMVDLSPALSRRITKTPRDSADPAKVWNLAHLDSGSFLKPIASESLGRGKSGFRPYVVILDEVHEHRTDAMVEFMRKNVKGRPNALVLMITNSGAYDVTSVCWRYHDYSDRLMRQVGELDDEFFAYVCGLDENDSWTDPAVWKKANPLLGVTIPQSYLEKEVREALGMPSKQSLTRRLNFCEWVGSVDPWVAKEVWDANAGAVDVQSLQGRTCFGAIDLSRRFDLTALVLVFPNQDGTKDVLLFAWAPEEGLDERAHRDKAPYRQWVTDGLLTTTPGKTIDYDFIAVKLGELTSAYDVQVMAFDHWHFDEMERALDRAGVTIAVMDHPQGFVGMNPAIEATEEDLKNARLRHGGNELLTWAVFNAKVEKNAAGLRAFDKQKQTGRIDPAVGLVMADYASQSFKPSHEPQLMFV